MFNPFKPRARPAPTEPWRQPQPPHATADDIAACFRLLLGRSPHPAEWPEHAEKIGRDLRAVVASFTGSPEFAHRGLVPPSPPVAARMADPSPPAAPLATADDVFYCFRLLLGRLPNPEEWLGHATQVGQDLQTVVAAYAGSLEFARRGLVGPARPSEVTLARQDGFVIHVSVDDAAVGQHVAGGAYEPDVAAVFRRLLRPGMSVIDIGANIGYFTMLSASLVGPAGHVLAIEPNPRNARLLEASRRENGFGQVTLCQAAAGRQTGILVLNTSHSNGTTSAPADTRDALLAAETVACLKVDALIDRGARVDLIKVDVEGAEYNALLGCTGIIEAWHPAILSEFSPDMMASISAIDGPGYLRWLLGFGYRLSVIARDGSLLPMGDDVGENVGGVMAAYAESGTDHIDILAVCPPGPAPA